MKKSLLCLIIILSLSSIPLKAQIVSYPADIEENIKKVGNNLAGWVQTGENDRWTLVERMKKYNINGVSIAVIHNYKIEWARGYGFADISEKRPVTEMTLFQAASISKSLNGVGVLKLVQENKLDLNIDINKYLITWKFPYDEKSNNKQITLTNLLSHTAGLTIHGFPGYTIWDTLPTLSQILNGQKPANTEAVRSSSEPGRKVIYSGGGVTISQMIIMDVTHQQYDTFMQKNVLDPLGMTNSSFKQPPSEEKEKILATGYRADGKEIPGRYHIYPEQAAAGLWTNPVDLCRYIIETQLSYVGKSAKVLIPEMTRLRLTPVLEDAALGVFISTRGVSKYFTHNGGNEGFSCYYTGSLDEGNGVVIMTNSDNGYLLCEEIVNSVATVYNWEGFYLPEIKKVVKVEESVLDKYQGKYDLNGTTVTFKKSDKDLVINVFSDISWKIYFTSDSDFFIREYKGVLRFQTDRNNKVSGFNFNGMTARKIE